MLRGADGPQSRHTGEPRCRVFVFSIWYRTHTTYTTHTQFTTRDCQLPWPGLRLAVAPDEVVSLSGCAPSRGPAAYTAGKAVELGLAVPPLPRPTALFPLPSPLLPEVI